MWCTLTDDREKDNAVLDYYLQHKEGVNPLSGEYDVIYVNGGSCKTRGRDCPNRVIMEEFVLFDAFETNASTCG